MSIALIVTRGYGTGSLVGSLGDIVLRGYQVGLPASPDCFVVVPSAINASECVVESDICPEETICASAITENCVTPSSIDPAETIVDSNMCGC